MYKYVKSEENKPCLPSGIQFWSAERFGCLVLSAEREKYSNYSGMRGNYWIPLARLHCAILNNY